MLRGLIGEVAVAQLPVLAERLAVIRAHDDQGRVEHPLGPQRIKQQSEGGIDVGDLPGIGVRREAGAVGLGRLVGKMWIEEVNEGEPAGLALGFHEFENSLHDLARGSLSIVHGASVLWTSSKLSNPRATPVCEPITVAATKPAVRRPASRSDSARVGSWGPRRDSSLSWTPCAIGVVPVSRVTWEGSVIGLLAMASSKRTPSSARRSRCGVISSGNP